VGDHRSTTRRRKRRTRRLVVVTIVGGIVAGITVYRDRTLRRHAARFVEEYGG
jgi:hypothetical protein